MGRRRRRVLLQEEWPPYVRSGPPLPKRLKKGLPAQRLKKALMRTACLLNGKKQTQGKVSLPPPSSVPHLRPPCKR
jgi:hypothetical protein